MASFYDNMGSTALSLLRSKGYPITLHRETGESVDPITGAVTAGTDASVETTGVGVNYDDRMIDGARILDGDIMLLLSNEHQPMPSDKPIIDGEEWGIQKIENIPAIGTAVAYKVQVRR